MLRMKRPLFCCLEAPRMGAWSRMELGGAICADWKSAFVLEQQPSSTAQQTQQAGEQPTRSGMLAGPLLPIVRCQSGTCKSHNTQKATASTHPQQHVVWQGGRGVGRLFTLLCCRGGRRAGACTVHKPGQSKAGRD